MPYADTDFFIAMANENDRLHLPAIAAYQRYRSSIYTSLAVMIELAIVSVKRGGTAEEPVSNAITLAELRDADIDKVLKAVYLIDRKNFSVFDAFHAALCGNRIISSDSVYDGIEGIERIPL